MLVTKDLSFTYPNGPSIRFPDLSCSSGSHLLVLGKSGSGKTTLLQLLAGLRRPSSGHIELSDTVIDQLSQAQMDRFRGQYLGLVYQQHHFVKALRVGENLALAQQLAGRKVDEAHIQNTLEQLDIGHKYDKRPHQLSVGEQQRLSIARAIINEPALILADEPTSALDDDNADRVLDLLRQRAEAVNAILIIVTHDQRLTSQIDQRIEL
ncbi:MAG: ATP-binding cassette domain-containing protein [Bacteroidota bacterium]